MTDIRPLDTLVVHGHTSLLDVSIQFATDVTVLIGANGSGKSNLIGVLELLGRIVDRQLQEHILTVGGYSVIRYSGPGAGDEFDWIRAEVWGVEQGGLRNGYKVELAPGPDDEALLYETLYFQNAERFAKPFNTRLGVHRESALADEARGSSRGSGIAQHVLPILEGCRVFHFDDVGPSAPPKRTSTIGDDIGLRWNAENIAAVLFRLKNQKPFDYARIVGAVQSVAPFFKTFILEPTTSDGERIRLRWQQHGADRVFTANEMSDGTLRFVCLATALLQPDRPSTIVLDEPELGLHPFAIHQLAGLVRVAASGGRRVILATQSVTLLSRFSLEEIAVLQRRNGCTEVSRPHPDEIRDFIRDYSLGELWEMNLLSGRPSSEAHDA